MLISLSFSLKMQISKFGELRFTLVDLTGVIGKAAQYIMPSTFDLIMKTCIFSVKLSDNKHVELQNQYSRLMRGFTGDVVGGTEEVKDTRTILKDDGILANGTETLIVCGHAVGKANSLLSWIVNLIWTKVISSGAIFEIWRLVKSLFSGLLLDVVELAKSTGTKNILIKNYIHSFF